MSCCNCNCKSVSISASSEGVWLEQGTNDMHVYSGSVYGRKGAVIGTNNESLKKGKISGTPIALSMGPDGCVLQIVTESNLMSHYNVPAEKVYERIQDLLHRLVAEHKNDTPISESQLKF